MAMPKLVKFNSSAFYYGLPENVRKEKLESYKNAVYRGDMQAQSQVVLGYSDMCSTQLALAGQEVMVTDYFYHSNLTRETSIPNSSTRFDMPYDSVEGVRHHLMQSINDTMRKTPLFTLVKDLGDDSEYEKSVENAQSTPAKDKKGGTAS
jgi:hypothetical protein